MSNMKTACFMAAVMLGTSLCPVCTWGENTADAVDVYELNKASLATTVNIAGLKFDMIVNILSDEAGTVRVDLEDPNSMMDTLELCYLDEDGCYLNVQNTAEIVGPILSYFVGYDDLEKILPDQEWICVDSEFLSLLPEFVTSLPMEEAMERLEDWADNMDTVELQNWNDMVRFDETSAASLVAVANEILHDTEEPLERLENNLLDRFMDDVAAALANAGSISEQAADPEVLRKNFQDWKELMLMRAAQSLQVRVKQTGTGTPEWNLMSLYSVLLNRGLCFEGEMEITDQGLIMKLTSEGETYTVKFQIDDNMLAASIRSEDEIEASIMIYVTDDNVDAIVKAGRTSLDGGITKTEEGYEFHLMRQLQTIAAGTIQMTFETESVEKLLEKPEAADLDTVVYEIISKLFGTEKNEETEE